MSETDRPSPERLATVSALAAKLAEKALAERMLQRPVDDQTVTALAEAVLVLEEHGHPVPPLALDLLARFFQERRRQPRPARRRTGRPRGGIPTLRTRRRAPPWPARSWGSSAPCGPGRNPDDEGPAGRCRPGLRRGFQNPTAA